MLFIIDDFYNFFFFGGDFWGKLDPKYKMCQFFMKISIFSNLAILIANMTFRIDEIFIIPYFGPIIKRLIL